MANKGLKGYTKQISYSVGDVAEVSVNINKNDANMHIIIPLFKTLGTNSIDLYLIFNYQDINKNGSFGKGVNINTFNNIVEKSKVVEVYKADGSILQYNKIKENTFYSTENNEFLTLSLISTTDGDFTGYSIKDQIGNEIFFDEKYTFYPTNIITKKGFRTLFDGINIDNTQGSKVIFTETTNDMYSKVTYLQDGVVLYYISFEYDLNLRLTNVKHYKENTLIKQLQIKYDENNIIVKDVITNDYVNCIIKENMVVSTEQVINNCEHSLNKINIDYYDKKTVIIDNDGRKSFVYFDDFDFPLYEIDDERNVVETRYDNNNKKLLYQSSAISTKNKDSDTRVLNIKDFTNENGLSIISSTVSDIDISNAVGQHIR